MELQSSLHVKPSMAKSSQHAYAVLPHVAKSVSDAERQGVRLWPRRQWAARIRKFDSRWWWGRGSGRPLRDQASQTFSCERWRFRSETIQRTQICQDALAFSHPRESLNWSLCPTNCDDFLIQVLPNLQLQGLALLQPVSRVAIYRIPVATTVILTHCCLSLRQAFDSAYG